MLAAVFSEKLKPVLAGVAVVEGAALVDGAAAVDGGAVVEGVIVDFAGGAIFFFSGSFAPSSSTRRSFEGRKGLSSASTAADCASAVAGVLAVDCGAVLPE